MVLQYSSFRREMVQINVAVVGYVFLSSLLSCWTRELGIDSLLLVLAGSLLQFSALSEQSSIEGFMPSGVVLKKCSFPSLDMSLT